MACTIVSKIIILKNMFVLKKARRYKNEFVT